MSEKKGLDPNKKIINLRGKEYKKSFPTQEEVDSLPIIKRIKQIPTGEFRQVSEPDISKLERETVGNVILNCLVGYRSKDRRDGFYINSIAQSIISAVQDKKNIVFKDKINIFLLKVLDSSIMREEVTKGKNGNEGKKEMLGMYASWVIAQIEEGLGVEMED